MPELHVASRRRTEFDVWNEVPLVPQLTGMSCWAAAAAMIIGWRDILDADPEQVAAGAGRWSEYRDGLRPLDLEQFARAWGLVSQNKLDWSVAEMRALLQRHGPLWLGEASPGLHSIVVTGMYGDGTTDGTHVRINDPWPIGKGERYTLTWRQLMTNFRNATSIAGVHAQLMHAAGRRRGNSRSLHIEEEHVTRSYINRHPEPKDVDMHTDDRRRHFEDYPETFGSPFAVAAAVNAGSAYVDTTASSPDPLAGHGGTGENLCLVWNQMPDETTAIDVVIHLHGYSARPADAVMLRGKVAAAGLDLARRARPTLAIVPRGRRITTAERRANARANASRYTFPALLQGNGAGLERLVAFALEHFRRNVLRSTASGSLAVDRLIITAHSGGGAPLNALLTAHAQRRICNPNEIHVYDATYGGVAGIVGWVRSRIAADRALPAADLASRGGGARVIYRRGPTQAGAQAIDRAMPPAGDALRAAYRAQQTAVHHNNIPSTYGGTLLGDVRAELVARAAAQALAADLPEWEMSAALALDDDVRAWLAADATGRVPFAGSVVSWIAATDRSAIELLADPVRRRRFLEQVNCATQTFPGYDGDSQHSAALFNAMATVVPERRVPRNIRYRNVASVVQTVPGTSYKLYPDAKDAFVRMRDAARADGLALTIGSAWRSEAGQQRAAQRNTNPNAVAQRVSAHNYGLAVDLHLSVPGLAITEISTRSMPNIVAMYRSPIYKWLALHAREHGWFPYRNEPWHWEYNPPGFKQRFESARIGGADEFDTGYEFDTGFDADGYDMDAADVPPDTVGAEEGGVEQAYGAPLGLMEHYRTNPPDVDAGTDGSYDADEGDAAIALQAPPAIDWCRYRQDVARIARAEEQRWRRPNGQKLLENEAAAQQILTQYWSAVPGAPVATAVQQSMTQQPANGNWREWSAAFLCFVLRQAGVTAQHGFAFGPRHLNYVVGALRNRERSDANRPFWLVDHVELVNEVTIQPGDLLCFNQPNRPAHTYSSLRQNFWDNNNQNAAVTGHSHCALVVGTSRNAAGQTVLETIGGNEQNSVRLRRNVPLAPNGGIANPAAHRIFGLIRMTGCGR
jgi:D-alanyl-D-alanine dipeptidase